MHFQDIQLPPRRVSEPIEYDRSGQDFLTAITLSPYRNFSLKNFPQFGNCFTFNDGLNEKDPRRHKRPISVTGNHYGKNGKKMPPFLMEENGQSLGLQMVLHLDRQNYMLHGLTESIGARMVIFDKKVDLMPDEFGFDLSALTRATVGLTWHRSQRLPAPYTSKCVRDWSETPFPKAQEKGTKYTLTVRTA